MEGYKEYRIMANEELVKFKYPGFVSDNYKYSRSLEKHNATRHDMGTKSQFVL